MTSSKSPPKRILLKLSGESLAGSQRFGIDPIAIRNMAQSIKNMADAGYQIAIVIGGGNIFRGVDLKSLEIERTPADQMGMLATLINGTGLQQVLATIGCKAVVMSALECPKVAAPYNWSHAIEHINQGTILIFVAGTGNPYFTTDTAAALRASEIQADILLKATKVDGVYDKDPIKFPDATRYSSMTYSQFLAEKIAVMDATAVTLCMSNQIPIFVFNMRLLSTVPVGTLLSTKDLGTLIHRD